LPLSTGLFGPTRQIINQTIRELVRG